MIKLVVEVASAGAPYQARGVVWPEGGFDSGPTIRTHNGRIDATSARRRLDAEMVRRGLIATKAEATALVEQRLVTVSGTIATNPSRQVLPGEPVELVSAPRYVSRGGLKLEKAIQRFSLDIHGCRALDAGSSTGGFTDALLQHGAASVMAVDVGTHQLHERIRADSRVTVREQTDIRTVTTSDVGGVFDVVVADLSFISVGVVLAHLATLTAADGDLVILVKPQFEATREEASRGRGIIEDPEVWRRTLVDTHAAAMASGVMMVDLVTSPIRGGGGSTGNVEFLAHLRHASSGAEPDPIPLVEKALREQQERS